MAKVRYLQIIKGHLYAIFTIKCTMYVQFRYTTLGHLGQGKVCLDGYFLATFNEVSSGSLSV
jgi:hypothetical protein